MEMKDVTSLSIVCPQQQNNGKASANNGKLNWVRPRWITYPI